jgi:HAD superfamily hydrolase (TIGR01484 family)
MDGTLLPTFAQEMSWRTAQALRAAQEAGITVAIATGRRTAYTAPLLEGLGLRADTPLLTSNGAVSRTLGGERIDRAQMEARVARGLCGLLRPFGVLVFTFDKLGRGELVLEELDKAQGRISLWVEANRNAIEVVKPLELALSDGEDPIQGMVTGSVGKMKKAEQALKASDWSGGCQCVRTEYPARDLSILDLLPPGVSKGWALERLAARLGVDRQ